jgi:hypothetical protein
MSDTDNQSPPAASAPPPTSTTPPRNGFLTAFMVLAGVILLMPGLCALGFGASGLFSSEHYESGMTPFILIGLLVGFGGIMLIRAAIRGRRP